MPEEKKRLLKARAQKRAKFIRQGASRKKKLEDTWRRPRGLHSKQRKQYRAKGAHPTPGYGSPLAIRGFHPSGYEEVLVHNPAELEGLDANIQAVRIGGTVGMKKRADIQQKALEFGLKVLNAKEIRAPEIDEEPVEEEDDE